LLVLAALARVPVRDRRILALREVNGLSYREVAASLDVPIGTVMSSLSRARRAYRAAVERQPETALHAGRASAAHGTSVK
jgi:RNA polymerase sigma-70 factor (ECF subfamily)